jgi:hypothetical protein
VSSIRERRIFLCVSEDERRDRHWRSGLTRRLRRETFVFASDDGEAADRATAHARRWRARREQRRRCSPSRKRWPATSDRMLMALPDCGTKLSGTVDP